MTDRDRLIELLKAIEKDPAITCPHWNENDCFNCPYDKEETCDMEARKADYLLANGVILPPCKVGDILWIPSVNSNKVYSKVIKEILIHEKDGEIGKYVYASSAYFPFENIGKTVFLTKEDAEEKLKELGK